MSGSGAGRAVLVTGASSGLGRACVLHLAEAGFHVFAGVRRPGDGDDLAAAASGRLTPVRVDVTDDASIAAAVKEIEAAVGDDGLWAVVNNAGVCVAAPLECVTTEELRRQLDTNVVGQLAVIRAFLPMLRRGRGRVVNVTSGLGSVAVPYMGAYSAAQFAKEALTDALRRELRGFGVDVSVVRPGAIMTPIWGKVADAGRAALESVPEGVASLYRVPFSRFLLVNERSARASSTTPAHFSRAVARALTEARPRARYGVGVDVWRLSVLSRVLPDRALDRYLGAITR
ncbi:SDR family oxidoreductase [Streptomyces sp. NPDC020379]|uniref:SDR family oxidoreductase n=1 Tax=Streptomyces sp. NPDC020379 TaxID=3365071 RepID=UPI0037B0A305